MHLPGRFVSRAEDDRDLDVRFMGADGRGRRGRPTRVVADNGQAALSGCRVLPGGSRARLERRPWCRTCAVDPDRRADRRGRADRDPLRWRPQCRLASVPHRLAGGRSAGRRGHSCDGRPGCDLRPLPVRVPLDLRRDPRRLARADGPGGDVLGAPGPRDRRAREHRAGRRGGHQRRCRDRDRCRPGRVRGSDARLAPGGAAGVPRRDRRRLGGRRRAAASRSSTTSSICSTSTGTTRPSSGCATASRFCDGVSRFGTRSAICATATRRGRTSTSRHVAVAGRA